MARRFTEKLTNVTDDELLKYGKRYNVDDTEKLYYMYLLEYGCYFKPLLIKHLSQFQTSMFHMFIRPSYEQAIKYWTDTIITISNSRTLSMFLKCATVDKYAASCATKSYSFVTDALKHLMKTTDMRIYDFGRFLDFCKIAYNEIYQSNKYKLDNCMTVMTWHPLVTTATQGVLSHVVLHEMVNDISFMREYIPYLDCPVQNKEHLYTFLDMLLTMVYPEREKNNDTDDSIGRVIEYILSGTDESPYVYWKKVYDVDSYDYDKRIVQFDYPHLYDALVKREEIVELNNVDEFRHKLINIVNNLYGKYDNIQSITMFDYLRCGGSSDFDRTLEMIDRTGITDYHNSLRQLRGMVRAFRDLDKEIDCSNIMNINYIIKGRKITDDEKRKIYSYMKRNHYPMNQILFGEIAREYVLGNIKLD